jgi:hypothetical protein
MFTWKVSNAYTVCYFELLSSAVTTFSVVEHMTYWGHQMLAGPVWNAWQEDCVNARIPNVTKCEALFYDMYLSVGNINPYAIDS